MAGGAQFDVGDIHGQTPLHLSLVLGYGSIADLFQDRFNSMLDQDDLTDIHFAIQEGHTSTIEKLISEGADLNIQSPDGHMCLHEAIKLCNKSETVVAQTDTLRKISDDYYRGELSPEKALVFYLLENGAKLDVRDERGNLPIQYAKDEVVKQMILSRLPSLEEITSHRNEPSTPAIVSVEVKSNTSQEIELEDHGVSMFIPPEAVNQSDRCKITFSLLRDLPSVDLQDDESVACYGIRCDPPNMIFHQPVRIRIPHSTLTINPDQVKPYIVSHVWDSVDDLPRTSRMSSSSSPDEPPYCRVYTRHLELYIGHCAEWWVLIPLEQQVIRHQLMCTPYIPDTIERGKEIEVHLHIHANLPGMDAENVIEYLINHGANVEKATPDGQTPLHLAASLGHLKTTKCVLSNGANMDKEDKDGHSALYSAVMNGHLDIVRYFISQGATVNQLDQDDLTDIHFAIQEGHTSTIEKLISEGADLNIQSPDGHMCLHEAIKLCNKSETVVAQTDTLRKISDDYYRGELSPEKALVFYLLENGAKLDVRDERGNLPIQYAKDEVVKQMILSRLPSLEEITSHRNEPSTPAIVSVEVKSNTSQEIELEDHGVSMFIPPEAVNQSDRCKITFSLLRDLPSVDLQDDESVACYGIRCDPPNMIFHQPVRIRIPHSTLTINPDQVKPYIVSHVWDSVDDLPRTSRMSSSSSPDEPPYCRVYTRHLELYIGHCAEWWVLIPLEQQVIRHQLMCTPYIPDTIERGKEIEVHLHIHANLPGMDAEVQEAEKKQSYRKVHPSVPISIATKSGDVQVTCCRQDEFEQSKSGQQAISQKDIQSKLKHSFLLPVTSRKENTDFPVIITITQAGKVGVSLSVAFLIRYSDELKYEPSLEPASFDRYRCPHHC
ncbi:ankyrin-3-like [Strongylocentrotus purpuratus]|uniref:ZU5 domain-containing protein n=1 Tax=Strongylocentrotus purpuratus TaxID=7668 RepID=A0A7M7T2R6_STRPU|nr:ankyrin-3-like [Strongylocentrotus purpuratus]